MKPIVLHPVAKRENLESAGFIDSLTFRPHLHDFVI